VAIIGATAIAAVICDGVVGGNGTPFGGAHEIEVIAGALGTARVGMSTGA
jgi:hypothetical protein